MYKNIKLLIIQKQCLILRTNTTFLTVSLTSKCLKFSEYILINNAGFCFLLINNYTLYIRFSKWFKILLIACHFHSSFIYAHPSSFAFRSIKFTEVNSTWIIKYPKYAFWKMYLINDIDYIKVFLIVNLHTMHEN